MKKLFFFIVLSIVYFTSINAQETEEKKEFKPGGKAFAKVFWNYHYDMTEGSEQRNNFQLQRSYLGYKYNFSETISTKITLDVGANDAGSDYTAFLKTAQLDWEVAKPVKISLGLIGTKQFKTQENFWGYRYILKSSQDEFGFGSSADLGINTELTFSKMLKANFFVLNGEGYKKLQDDMGRMKVGGNIEFHPVEGITVLGYYDNYGGNIEIEDPLTNLPVVRDTASINTVAFFAGYETEKFRVGAEYNMQMDGKKYASQAEGYDLNAIAAYATFIINEKFEVFGKYMNLTSNKIEGATENWNNSKDGSFILGGLQYKPVKGVKVALNYRTFIHEDSDIADESALYLNFEYSF